MPHKKDYKMLRTFKALSLSFVMIFTCFSFVPLAFSQFSPTSEFLDGVKDNDMKEIRDNLSKGANINGRNNDGIPAVIIASDRSDLRMLKFLLENGAKPDTKSLPGQETALMRRSGVGDVESMKLLIAFKADVDRQDKMGQTGIMKAALSRKRRAVQALIDAGADLFKSDHTGKTALQHARESRDRRIVKMLEDAGATY
jgi:ankyrin repeat protein